MRTPFAFLIVLLIALPLSAAQITCTFDDVPPGQTVVVAMPSNYCGISWASNFGVYSVSQPPYNPHSYPVRALVNYLPGPFPHSALSFLTPGGVVFEGAWFAGWRTVGYSLYSGGTLVHSTPAMGLSGTPTFLASGYAGLVDTVTIDADAGAFVFDDLTYSTTAAVPETSTISLLGLGTLAIGLVRRKLARLK